MDVKDLAKLGELAETLKELENTGVSLDDVLRGTRAALEEKKKADILAQQIAQGKENLRQKLKEDTKLKKAIQKDVMGYLGL